MPAGDDRAVVEERQGALDSKDLDTLRGMYNLAVSKCEERRYWLLWKKIRTR